MLGWVADAALGSRYADRLVIATPDEVIFRWATQNNLDVMMTRDSHERATDRVAEVMQKDHARSDVYVLFQGDEPLLTAEDLDLAIEGLARPTESIA